jgi:hypothetical protein
VFPLAKTFIETKLENNIIGKNIRSIYSPLDIDRSDCDEIKNRKMVTSKE